MLYATVFNNDASIFGTSAVLFFDDGYAVLYAAEYSASSYTLLATFIAGQHILNARGSVNHFVRRLTMRSTAVCVILISWSFGSYLNAHFLSFSCSLWL
jgi:hypothetical protein